jgi:hypothetical protein
MKAKNLSLGLVLVNARRLPIPVARPAPRVTRNARVNGSMYSFI